MKVKVSEVAHIGHVWGVVLRVEPTPRLNTVEVVMEDPLKGEHVLTCLVLQGGSTTTRLRYAIIKVIKADINFFLVLA